MNFLILIKTLIIILFPLTFYKTIENSQGQNNKIELLSIIASLIICFSQINYLFTIFINIPLSILYFKRNKKKYIIISVLSIFLFKIYNVIIIIPLFEYLLLLPFIKNKNFLLFITTTILFYLISIKEIEYLVDIIIVLFMYIIIESYIFKIYINSNYKQLEDEYKDYFLKFIHEVKNPLSVALGYTEIIEKKKNIKDKNIIMINKEIKDSVDIIDSYLLLGKKDLKKEYLDINLLLREITNDLKPLQNSLNFNINYYYDEEEIIVYGDYLKLKQVLLNIIKNSIESKTDKRLDIDIDYRIIKDKVLIEINDNGTGIKNISYLGKNKYTSKEKGNGLGISFSKNIIELHNGTINYYSQELKGTEVKILIPCVNI